MSATVRGHLHTFAYEDPRTLAHQADLVWSSHHSQTIHQISKDDINLSTEELACNTVNHRLQKKYYSESSRYKNYHSFSTSGFCFYCQKMERKLGIAQILVLIHQIRGTVGHMGEDKLKLFFCRYRNKNITVNLSNRYSHKPGAYAPPPYACPWGGHACISLSQAIYILHCIALHSPKLKD